MTLTELFEEYSANRSDLTRKCAANMRQRMQKYVLPALGARDIEGIRVSEIYRLLQDRPSRTTTLPSATSSSASSASCSKIRTGSSR